MEALVALNLNFLFCLESQSPFLLNSLFPCSIHVLVSFGMNFSFRTWKGGALYRMQISLLRLGGCNPQPLENASSIILPIFPFFLFLFSSFPPFSLPFFMKSSVKFFPVFQLGQKFPEYGQNIYPRKTDCFRMGTTFFLLIHASLV